MITRRKFIRRGALATALFSQLPPACLAQDYLLNRRAHFKGGGSAPPFSPSDVSGLALWLKADAAVYKDAGSTPCADADNVYHWDDQSGSGYSAVQGTTANRPNYYVNIQNGLPIIRFNGSSDYLSLATAVGIDRNRSGFSVFMVLSSDTVAVGHRDAFFLARNGSSTQSRVFLGANITSGLWATGGRTEDADSVTNLESVSSLSTSTFYQVCAIFDYADTALYLYLGGSTTPDASQTNYHTATATSDTDSNVFYIGAVSASANQWDGDIGEVLCYTNKVSAPNQALIGTYLATRWGL